MFGEQAMLTSQATAKRAVMHDATPTKHQTGLDHNLESKAVGALFCATLLSFCRCPTVMAARQRLFCTPACTVGARMAC